MTFFVSSPYKNPALVLSEAAVRGLNPVVAVKLCSSSVLAAMAKVYAVPHPPPITLNVLTVFITVVNRTRTQFSTLQSPTFPIGL